MKFIFYDLETNSLNTSDAAIMQIGIMDEENNILMNHYVYPYNGVIAATEIHGIDQNVLEQNNALNTVDMLNKFISVIKFRYGNDDIYLTAYNNFGYDQQVLEYNLKRFNILLPDNWYFTDMFPYVKYKYPSFKYDSFKLGNVYQKIIRTLDANDESKMHTAIFDVQMMKEIFDKNKSDRILLIKYFTRHQINNKKILNCSIENIVGFDKKPYIVKMFNKNSIKTIGDLYNKFALFDYDVHLLDYFIENNLNVKSSFNRKRMVNEISNIKNLIN